MSKVLTSRFAPLGVWIVLICGLTLTPSSSPRPNPLEGFFCLACGWGYGADIIRNWALFVPLGVLGARRLGALRSIAWSASLAIAVELIQVWVPGRDPAVRDIVSNAFGAATGALFVRTGIQPIIYRTLPFLVALAWLAPAVLLIPRRSEARLFGQWTPDLLGMSRYDGRVLDARVGAHSIGSGLLGDRTAIAESMRERESISLRLTLGRPPSSFAPIFQLVDEQSVSLVSVGASGQDLILRFGTIAGASGLDEPEARWQGALRGLAPGDTTIITVDRSGGAPCISIGGRMACGIAPSVGDGWSLLVSSSSLSGWSRLLLGLAWSFFLGIAATTRGSTSVPSALGIGVGLAALGAVVGVLSDDLRVDSIQGAAIAAGGLIGPLLRRPHSAWARAEVTR